MKMKIACYLWLATAAAAWSAAAAIQVHAEADDEVPSPPEEIRSFVRSSHGEGKETTASATPGRGQERRVLTRKRSFCRKSSNLMYKTVSVGILGRLFGRARRSDRAGNCADMCAELCQHKACMKDYAVTGSSCQCLAPQAQTAKACVTNAVCDTRTDACACQVGFVFNANQTQCVSTTAPSSPVVAASPVTKDAPVAPPTRAPIKSPTKAPTKAPLVPPVSKTPTKAPINKDATKVPVAVAAPIAGPPLVVTTPSKAPVQNQRPTIAAPSPITADTKAPVPAPFAPPKAIPFAVPVVPPIEAPVAGAPPPKVPVAGSITAPVQVVESPNKAPVVVSPPTKAPLVLQLSSAPATPAPATKKFPDFFPDGTPCRTLRWCGGCLNTATFWVNGSGIKCGTEPCWNNTNTTCGPHPSCCETHPPSFAGRVTSLVLTNSPKSYTGTVAAVDLQNTRLIPLQGPSFGIWEPGIPRLNINATVNSPNVLSVLFEYNGQRFRVDNGPTFSFCGESGSGAALKFLECDKLGLGEHSVKATPYSGRNAKGQAGVPMQVTFEIAAEDKQPPYVSTFQPLVSGPIDVTDGDVTVQFTVTAEDSSGIYFPRYDKTDGRRRILRSVDISNVTKDRFGFPVIIPQDTLRHTFSLSTVISRHATPGDYNFTFVLSDKVGNIRQNETSITVVNRGLVDSDAPKVLSFNATPNAIPYVNSGPGQVHNFDVTMTVQDDLSGIASAVVVILDASGRVYARWIMNETTPVVGAKTFHFSLDVLAELESLKAAANGGAFWELFYRVTLIDRDHRKAVYNSHGYCWGERNNPQFSLPACIWVNLTQS